MTKIHVSLYYFGRFITVTYFLTDVDDGGEVVVPLANNKFEVFSSYLCIYGLICISNMLKALFHVYIVKLNLAFMSGIQFMCR